MLVGIYGPSWTKSFLSQDDLTIVSQRLDLATNSPYFHENAIHALDLSKLIYYLFLDFSENDIAELIDLSTFSKRFANRTEEQIEAILSNYRKASIWDRATNMGDYATHVPLKKIFQEISSHRNKFAHFRVISNDDYDKFMSAKRKLLPEIDKALIAIDSNCYDKKDLIAAFTTIADLTEMMKKSAFSLISQSLESTIFQNSLFSDKIDSAINSSFEMLASSTLCQDISSKLSSGMAKSLESLPSLHLTQSFETQENDLN